ncbi:MAG: hypothetical protein JRK53_00270 [Deltaproteobacteria bacterium]|nr:hypothetical protein [Deltaproteobacteria bacterium]
MAFVDLTKGKIESIPLDGELVGRFIGGWGVNNRLAYDLIPPKTDPFAPENAIIIGTGPFSGTIVPGSAELFITSRFPLNNSYATACGGGHFAMMLKLSGYDHLAIFGKAEKPVYIKVENKNIEICDATDLWGRDSFDTVDALRRRHQPCSVIPIGPAGENLVRISVTSIDKGGTVGSGGLPAVMGSKNLKAIVAVKGSIGIHVADHKRLRRLVGEMEERIMNYRLRDTLLEGGFFGMTANWARMKAQISENGTKVSVARLPDVKDIHYESRKPLACAGCPTADKEVIRIQKGPYKGMVSYLTHYSMRDFPGVNPEEEYGKSVKYMDTANRVGICLFSFEAVRDFMVHLNRSRFINKKDVSGFILGNDFETTMRLIDMTAHRQGIGTFLSEGVVRAARKIGKGVEKEAMHIKGYPWLGDPRLTGFGTSTLAQMVNPARSGGCAGIAGSLGSASYNPERPIQQWVKGAKTIGVTDDAMSRIFTENLFNVGRLTKHAEDWYSVSNCLGLCHRLYINRFFDARMVAGLYSAITGIETTPDELLGAGERAWNLFKLLNVRSGFTRKDDRPPKVWFSPLKGQGAEFHLMDYYKRNQLGKEDVECILDDYYHERRWDKKTGTPTAQTLEKLGLGGL